MKSYEEVTKDLLVRRDRYAARQKEHKKRLTAIASALGCFTLVAALGFSQWRDGMFPTQAGIPTEPNAPIAAGTSGEDTLTGTYWVPGDSAPGADPGPEQSASTTPAEEPETPSVTCIPTDPTQNLFDPCEHIPSVTLEGADYLQFSSYDGTYTPGQCLGDLRDFEGTYGTFWPEVTGKLFVSNEDPDVLVLVFEDGSSAPLFKVS